MMQQRWFCVQMEVPIGIRYDIYLEYRTYTNAEYKKWPEEVAEQELLHRCINALAMAKPFELCMHEESSDRLGVKSLKLRDYICYSTADSMAMAALRILKADHIEFYRDNATGFLVEHPKYSAHNMATR